MTGDCIHEVKYEQTKELLHCDSEESFRTQLCVV